MCVHILNYKYIEDQGSGEDIQIHVGLGTSMI